jgi:hypothetical protein
MLHLASKNRAIYKSDRFAIVGGQACFALLIELFYTVIKSKPGLLNDTNST